VAELDKLGPLSVAEGGKSHREMAIGGDSELAESRYSLPNHRKVLFKFLGFAREQERQYTSCMPKALSVMLVISLLRR
jgi:hypothetical protein